MSKYAVHFHMMVETDEKMALIGYDKFAEHICELALDKVETGDYDYDYDIWF